MEIQIKAYAYTIDIITEIRYFCKCNNAVFGKFRIIFTCAISKTDCSLHHNFHALFKISGNGKFVRTVVLPPYPSRNLRKSTPHPRTAPPHQPSQNRTIPCLAPPRLPPLSKVRCCRPKEFGRLPEGLLHHYPLAPHQPSRTRTIPLAFRRGASLLLPLHRIPPLPKTTINPNRKALKRIPVAKQATGIRSCISVLL